MARLILVLMAIAIFNAVVRIVSGLVTSATRAAVQTTKEADVPGTTKTISYVLLIALMFGVVTGWFGGL